MNSGMPTAADGRPGFRLHRRYRVPGLRCLPEYPARSPASASAGVRSRRSRSRGSKRPYDWAIYAQFPPALPRMPSWWPLNMTWGGGLPSAVPIGYIAYFVLPAVIGAALGRRVVARGSSGAGRMTLLVVGFVGRLLLGAGVQRVLRSPPRGLLLRLRDRRAGAVRGHQISVPDLRRRRDGLTDDGVHLPARPHRRPGPQRHRGVVGQTFFEQGRLGTVCRSPRSWSWATSCTGRCSRRTWRPSSAGT